MKNSSNVFFVVLGVIFLIFILVGIGFILSRSSRLELVKQSSAVTTGTIATSSTGSTEADTGFTLSVAQKNALVSLGIDSAKIPTAITSTQVACFVKVLGVARVAEIRAGAVPSAIEFFNAKGCI